ncbi:MAG: preprotein translocase subunit YajC [bacterium]
MFFELASAMAGPAQQQGAGASGFNLSFLMPFALIFVIFYFLIIRPQTKERKKMQDLLDNLKAGDRVVTAGGIFGTIHSVSDTTIELKVAEKVKITVLRSSVRALQGSEIEESSDQDLMKA